MSGYDDPYHDDRAERRSIRGEVEADRYENQTPGEKS